MSTGKLCSSAVTYLRRMSSLRKLHSCTVDLISRKDTEFSDFTPHCDDAYNTVIHDKSAAALQLHHDIIQAEVDLAQGKKLVWPKNSGSYISDTSTNAKDYTSQIEALCEQERVEEAEKLVTEMMNSGIKPDRSVFWCVIDALVEQGHLNKAQNHLENMFKTSCSRKRPSYVPLLLELSVEGDVGLAKDLFFHMYRDESLEMYKDVVNYDALFDILYTSGNEEEAKKLVESMAENPDYFLNDVKLINVTFDNLCKKGSLDAAVSVLKIMLVELYEIRDMVGCSALINALCFEGRFCEALDVIALVEKRGYQLDTGTYNTLMDEYCKEEMFEDAFDLLLEMEGKGFSPNVATLNTLVSGFARQKEGARVEEILQKMHAMKISPNLDTKSILSSMELAL